MIGLVSLVGAGPGDPELLTLKAVRRLAEADLVLYDALVPPEIVSVADHAQRFFVGKRARRPAIRQDTIHTVMIRAAHRGKRVVRLKCGDPFVFGRGAEEALALADAGVPFEVVPGVSAAIAAPELAGIPVTHRGLVSSFVVVSAHAEEAYRPVLEGLLPGAATVVVLMGLARRAALARFLRRRGWPAATPTALLVGASTPRSWTWTGTLGELGAVSLPETAGDAPGTVVIGEVVTLASHIGSLAQLGGALAPAAGQVPD